MGTSCLLTARVSGCNRDPEPPARMIPFSTASKPDDERSCNHENAKTRNARKISLYKLIFVGFVFSCVSWRSRSSETKPLSVVPSGLHPLAPVAMLEIPAHGVAQAALERVARRPSELAPNLRRVDRVPAIVAGAIGHERLQPA